MIPALAGLAIGLAGAFGALVCVWELRRFPEVFRRALQNKRDCDNGE